MVHSKPVVVHMLGHPNEEDTGLWATLKALPKVDLHRHLEGSLRLETLCEIAREYQFDLPGYTPQHLKPFVTLSGRELDFQRFLNIFSFLRRFYVSRDMIQRVVYEAIADAAADTVRYLELRFNPIALAQTRGFGLDDVTGWVCEAAAWAERDTPLRTGLIIQIGRSEPLFVAQELVQVALAYRDKGIVGVDLAGDETQYPLHRFAELFQRARSDGLNVTVHAGEASGAENVRLAIEQLAAQRVGHGVHVIEDPRVVQLAREHQTIFEVCPMSNLYTGIAGRQEPHPLPRMLEAGLRVTVNTDDPGITGTTLTDEYVTVISDIQISISELKQMILTGAEGAFQPGEVCRQLAAELREEFLANG